jgi:hypothetical protein
MAALRLSLEHAAYIVAQTGYHQELRRVWFVSPALHNNKDLLASLRFATFGATRTTLAHYFSAVGDVERLFDVIVASGDHHHHAVLHARDTRGMTPLLCRLSVSARGTGPAAT